MKRVAAIVVFLVAVVSRSTAHPPSGIVVDEKGRVLFQDGKEGLWRVDEDGRRTLVNKVAWHWLAFDADGKFSQAEDEFGEWFARMTPKGEKPALIACSDFPCVIGKDGNLYYAKDHSLTIVRRTPQGEESILVGREKFKFDEKQPGGVNGIACGPDGALYVVALNSINKHEGTGEHALYLASTDGTIRELARNFVREPVAENDRHPEARPQYSRGIAVDDKGNVFVAVTGSRCVMKRSAEGEWTVVVRCEKPWSPTGVTLHNDELYVLEYDDETPTQGRNWPPRVRKVGANGRVTLVAQVRGK